MCIRDRITINVYGESQTDRESCSQADHPINHSPSVSLGLSSLPRLPSPPSVPTSLTQGLNVAVAGVPKTIDNDVDIIDRSFGFLTAVEVGYSSKQAGSAKFISFSSLLINQNVLHADVVFIPFFVFSQLCQCLICSIIAPITLLYAPKCLMLLLPILPPPKTRIIQVQ